jgi:hypothetical protein
VFFGPEEYLQISEYPTVLWSVISEDLIFLQHQGCYVLLTANKSPEYNEIPPDKMCGKAVQYNLDFCGASDAGEKRTFELILNLKYFFELRVSVHRGLMNKIPTRCNKLSLFLFVFCSTCFGRYIHPLSGVSTVQAGMV